MAKSKLQPRIMKVTGYLVLQPKDEAFRATREEIAQDGSLGLWGIGELDDLTVIDVPGAVVTEQGIRTDQ